MGLVLAEAAGSSSKRLLGRFEAAAPAEEDKAAATPPMRNEAVLYDWSQRQFAIDAFRADAAERHPSANMRPITTGSPFAESIAAGRLGPIYGERNICNFARRSERNTANTIPSQTRTKCSIAQELFVAHVPKVPSAGAKHCDHLPITTAVMRLTGGRNVQPRARRVRFFHDEVCTPRPPQKGGLLASFIFL